jgi:hypothetical protein
MAGNIVDGTANNLLDVLLGAGANSVSPATVYVALSTTTPANDGTNVTEPSGNGYARVAVTNDTTHWPAASSRTKSNGATITFPTATASWGTPTYAVIYTASTGGSVLAFGPIGTPTAIGANAVADFPASSISITA